MDKPSIYWRNNKDNKVRFVRETINANPYRIVIMDDGSRWRNDQFYDNWTPVYVNDTSVPMTIDGEEL